MQEALLNLFFYFLNKSLCQLNKSWTHHKRTFAYDVSDFYVNNKRGKPQIFS